jgi:hypothetical protein
LRKEEEILQSWFQERTAPEDIDAQLEAAGFDTARLATRFENAATEAASGVERRRRSREAYDRVITLVEEIRTGLKGERLQEVLQEFRNSLPPGPGLQAIPAYRNLVQETGIESTSKAQDEAEILQDLLALAKLLETQDALREDEQSG